MDHIFNSPNGPMAKIFGYDRPANPRPLRVTLNAEHLKRLQAGEACGFVGNGQEILVVLRA